MSEDALTAQVRSELEQIAAVVSDLTGLPSNWNGELVLVPDAGFQGKKLYSCGILISRELADSDLRWRTLIHEALHAVSVDYSRKDYEDFIGWEEGVVEQMQRLLRPQVLARLGISVDDKAIQKAEQEHYYNRYVSALEQIRQALGIAQAGRFYLNLLSAPIKDRPFSLLDLSKRLSRVDYLNFVRVFSASSSVLKEGDKTHVVF